LPARRRDKCGPPLCLADHRAVIRPRRRVGQRPLGVTYAARAGADRGVVSITAKKLKRRSRMKLKKHVVVLHPLDRRLRKCVENAALAGACVDAVPDRFSRLLILGEAVPVRADFTLGQFRRALHQNLVFAGAAVPDGHVAVKFAVDERVVQPLLIPADPKI